MDRQTDKVSNSADNQWENVWLLYRKKSRNIVKNIYMPFSGMTGRLTHKVNC